MIGSTISHYKILEKLGEGGMGVVFKARDTKLNRTVALKFLPSHVSEAEKDKERFLQEAQAAASLSHANICTIFGIDEHDGKQFIVMEYVDGQTLHEKKQNLSLKQALEIGIQVSDGLAAAHDKGIVHRDIKPENIMIKKDGTVQIMDFGLAKLRGATRLTKEGSTVGTVGYMSPEQVQGMDVDHRTDIFSLGVLLYEMFTGQSPFKGVHETAIIYEIVNVDPSPMGTVKSDIDTDLDAIVLDCLAKDPADRYQSAAELSRNLKRFKRESSRSRVIRMTNARPIYKESGTVEQPPKRRPALRELAAWTLSGVLLVAVSLFAFFSQRGTDSRVVRSSLLPPDNFEFDSRVGGHIAISPNGKLMAFVATDSVMQKILWVRPLNALSGQQLNGTEGASYPFWSPDSRFIGFFVGGKLMKIEASGGPPLTICDVGNNARGGAWNADGVILFASTGTGPLSRVSAAGGSPGVATVLDTAGGHISHRWPFFLPDGNHFLYSAQTTITGNAEKDAICLGSLDSPDARVLFHASSNSAYASGHILFLRERTLMAQPFDPGSYSLNGDAFPVAEQVSYWADRNKAIFTVSDNGVLAYQSGAAGTSQLIWFDRNGKQLDAIGKPGTYGHFRISPDERSVATEMVDQRFRNSDIWIYDFTRKNQTRFTFDPGPDMSPVWSPDGGRIVFGSSRRRGTGTDLYQRASSGIGNEEMLTDTLVDKFPSDWSPDGQFIVFTALNRSHMQADLWLMPMTGVPTPVPFLQTDFGEINASFSPDGKWIAYQSNESGATQVYVRPFPGPGGKYQVSTSPGTSPRWRGDGKEVYFLGDDKTLRVVEVDSKGRTFIVGRERVLFQTNPMISGLAIPYDVTGDGKRFLVCTVKGETSSTSVTLVVNWDAELKEQ